jgi:hypothetical protein
VNDRVENILLSGIRTSWGNAIHEVEAAGGKPHAIPADASSICWVDWGLPTGLKR